MKKAKVEVEIEVVKGYKGFNKNLCCTGGDTSFQYEVGKTYEMDENIEVCIRGFHFCKSLFDVHGFYSFNNEDNRFCEVVALGKVLDDENNDKSVTNIIKITREISKKELEKMINAGNRNTGYCNTGDWNTGNRNTGNRNTGDWNTGNRNTGNRNTGNRNTGDWNTGYRNTGDWNKTERSSGVFCNIEPKLILFNQETDMTYEKWQNTKAYGLLNNIEKNRWLYENDMSEEEKQQYSSYKTQGGYLKEIPRKEANNDWWSNLDNFDKNEIFSLPNFDLVVFNDIMELNITKKEYREVLKNVKN